MHSLSVTGNQSLAVDSFLLVWLDQKSLRPKLVLQTPVRIAMSFLRKDSYQGSFKLRVDAGLVKRSRLLLDRRAPVRAANVPGNPAQ